MILESPPDESYYRITLRDGKTRVVCAPCATIALLSVMCQGYDVKAWEVVNGPGEQPIADDKEVV